MWRRLLKVHLFGDDLGIQTGLAMMVKAASAVAQFVLNLLVARVLGAEGAGMYFLAFATAHFGTVVGRFGLDSAVMRFVGAFTQEGRRPAARAVYWLAMGMGAAVSTLVTVVILLGREWLATSLYAKPDLAALLIPMGLATPFMTLYLLHGEALKGAGKTHKGLMIQSVFANTLAIPGVYFLGRAFGVWGATWAFWLAAVGSVVAGFLFWRSSMGLRPVDWTALSARLLIRTSTPLFLVMALNVVLNWSGSVFLGIWHTRADVGIFNAAFRLAMFSSFALLAVNSIVGPRLAALKKDVEARAAESERLLHRANAMMLAWGLLVTPVLILFQGPLMQIFGPEYPRGGMALAILAVGQLISSTGGAMGLLLAMTGDEITLRNILMATGAFNVLVSLLLIPPLGLEGAALAVTLSFAVKVSLTLWAVWTKRGIALLPANLLGALFGGARRDGEGDDR